jgi:hypothetical protein
MNNMSTSKNFTSSIKQLVEYKNYATGRYHKINMVDYFWYAIVVFVSVGSCIAFNLDIGLSWISTPLSALLALFFAKVMLAVSYINLWPIIILSWIVNAPKESMDSYFTDEFIKNLDN